MNEHLPISLPIDQSIKRVPDDAIRIKVINDCQWSCSFCHNEGTELPTNHSSRVSVFLDEKVNLLPNVEEMPYTPEIMEQLYTLRYQGITEVHLTGGEPTLYRQLPSVVRDFKEHDFTVKMTTNGQAKPEMTRALANAGIDGITFSVLSFDDVEFVTTQEHKSEFAARLMIHRERENILLAKSLGVSVKINTVVLGEFDYPRVDTVRQFAEDNGITLVLLNSLGDGEEASQAVFNYAQAHGQLSGGTEFTNNSKGSLLYTTDRGTQINAKYIRPYHPDVVCGDCEHKGKSSCVEKFYGLRMEFRDGQPWIRLCVQKTTSQTVMPFKEFIIKDIMKELL